MVIRYHLVLSPLLRDHLRTPMYDITWNYVCSGERITGSFI